MRVRRLVLYGFVAALALLAAPSIAAEDYGKTFFGVPLGATPSQAGKILAATNGFTVEQSKGERGPVVVARFSGGDMTVKYAGNEISFIHYTRGLLLIEGLRQVDDYFVQRLGRPVFIELEDTQPYFPETGLRRCAEQCAEQCAGEQSIFSCDSGRQCHASCRSGLVPKDAKALQDFLFDGTARTGGGHASFWSCSDRGGDGEESIFAGAPKDCILRVQVNSCRTAEAGGTTGVYCRYGTLYRNYDLERRFDSRQVATAEPAPGRTPQQPAVTEPEIAAPPSREKEGEGGETTGRGAIARLTAQIVREPGNARLLMARSEIYLRNGQPEAAIRDLLHAKQLGAGGRIVEDGLARARQMQAGASAPERQSAAAESQTETPEELIRKSERRVATAQGVDARLAAVSRVLQNDADDLTALRERADLLTEAGRHELALRDVEHYERLKPGDPWAAALRGHLDAELSKSASGGASSTAQPADNKDDRPEPGGVTIAHTILGLPTTADLEMVERFMQERGARETEREGDDTATILTFEDHGAEWALFFSGAALTSVDYASAPIGLSNIDESYRKLLDDFGFPNHIDSYYGEDRSAAGSFTAEQKPLVDRHQECRAQCLAAQTKPAMNRGTYACIDMCFYEVPSDVDGLLAWLSNDHASLPLFLRLFQYHGAHPPLVWSCNTPPSGNPFRERADKDCAVEGSVDRGGDSDTFKVRIAYRNRGP